MKQILNSIRCWLLKKLLSHDEKVLLKHAITTDIQQMTKKRTEERWQNTMTEEEDIKSLTKLNELFANIKLQ